MAARSPLSAFSASPGALIDLKKAASEWGEVGDDVVVCSAWCSELDDDEEVAYEDHLSSLSGMFPFMDLRQLRIALPSGAEVTAEILCQCVAEAGTGLKELSLGLAGNQALDGPACLSLVKAFPAGLTALHLDLTYAEVRESAVSRFFESLPRKLLELDLVLAHWELGSEGAAALAAALASMSSLVRLSLDLVGCDIEVEGLQAILSALGELKLKGVRLLLAENSLGDDGAQTLADQLQAVFKPDVMPLEEFGVNLTGNSSSVATIVQVLDFCKSHGGTLRDLGFSLQYEPPEEELVKAVAVTLQACGRLERLDLDLEGNELGALQTQLLQSLPVNLSTLRFVLARCEVGSVLEQQPQEFAVSMKRLTSLDALELVISKNYLSDGQLGHVIDALQQATKLTSMTLNFCSNLWTHHGAQKLMDCVKALPSLKYVRVELDTDLDDEGRDILRDINKLRLS